MAIDPAFIEATRYNAIHKWQWRRPWLAAVLGVFPLGMLYTSIGTAMVYGCVSFAWLSWDGRPKWAALLIVLAFSTYAYNTTRWRNAAIERWKYGLPGTGNQNPKGMEPIVQEELEKRSA